MKLSTAEIKKLKLSYNFLKSYTKKRIDRNGNPIGWELTFDQWLDIWIKSGHLSNRGTHSGGYVMARKGDIGPYNLDNVDIILHSDNIKFAKSYYKVTDELKSHLSKLNKGKTYSEEHKKKLSEVHKKRWESIDKTKLNWKPSQETLEKMRKPRGPRPTTVCPHCNVQGAIANLKRYHFNNCKFN